MSGSIPEKNSLIPKICRVVGRRVEAENVVTLCLEPETGGPWQSAPGQFNMLYAFGVGEVPVSVSQCASDNEPIWHTVRAVGPVSAALCRLQVGSTLGMRGPFGNAWPLDVAEKKDVLVVAGGLGLAPMRPVIQHLLTRREFYGRVVVLYGCRSREAIIFDEDLAAWAQNDDLELLVTVDRADQAWGGRVGAITTLIDSQTFDPQSVLAMVCGPSLMMRFVVAALTGASCPESSIFVSMERNMKCAIGQCGRCQYGPHFVCRDGPIFRYDKIGSLFRIADI